MAQVTVFFERAGILHPEHRTPVFALKIQAAWASVPCLSGSYGQLPDYVIIADVLFYRLTAVGLFVLRVTRPEAERHARVPLYPWLPAAYVIGNALICIALLVQKPQYTWPGIAIVTLGLPVYWLSRHRRAV